MSSKAKVFWLVFVVGLVLDQATKLWVAANLTEGIRGEIITVIPGFFDIVHAENPGAAFSMFRDFEYRHLLFLGFTAIACWVVWDQYRKLNVGQRLYSAALALIASGALGNAIDRLSKRTVTDFLRFHVEEPSWRAWLVEKIGTNEYPSFNIADSLLLVGVIFIVFAGNKADKKDDAAQSDAPKAATSG